MATISWTLPAAALSRLLAALGSAYGYVPFLDPPDNTRPNPETREQFVHRMVGEEWRRRTVLYERQLARDAVPLPIEPDIA